MKFFSVPKWLKKLWRFLQRPDLLFYLLGYFMVLLVIGTLAQKSMGETAAIKMFFNSFILWYGILPLPAGALILSLIFLNLLVHFIVKSTWNLHGFGNNLSHLSILILLLGGAITLMEKQEGFVILREEDTTQNAYQSDEQDFLNADSKPAFTLPFAVTLETFDQNYYSGTDIAEYYLSTVNIQGKRYFISMNEPLRYQGYTFYQSSVLNLPNRQVASVLSVVRNPGWLFPYIATAMLFIGLVFHAGVRRYERK